MGTKAIEVDHSKILHGDYAYIITLPLMFKTTNAKYSIMTKATPNAYQREREVRRPVLVIWFIDFDESTAVPW